MRYLFTYEPPQPNSPLEIVKNKDQRTERKRAAPRRGPKRMNNATNKETTGRAWKRFYSFSIPRPRLLQVAFPMVATVTAWRAAWFSSSLLLNSRTGRWAVTPTLLPSFPFSEKNKVQSSGISILHHCSHLFYTSEFIFHFKLESSSTGSSFPADFAKPVPFAVGSRARK